MSDVEFLKKAEAVRTWFKPLNPYAVDVDLFKLEDANFKVVDGKPTADLEPLYCFAISSKRYVLFNIDDQGRPVIRKASAHGLGHLAALYNEKDAPADIPAPVVILDENGINRWQDKIGVSRWQYDFWYCIARAPWSVILIAPIIRVSRISICRRSVDTRSPRRIWLNGSTCIIKVSATVTKSAHSRS